MGLGMASADGISVACLMLVAGIPPPRPAKMPSRWRSRSSCTSISSPITLATVSRVRSSDVGPSPPEVMVTSARRQARSIVSKSLSGWSPTLETQCTSMPNLASSAAMYAELVSTISPKRISVPMAMISAFKGRLQSLCHSDRNLCHSERSRGIYGCGDGARAAAGRPTLGTCAQGSRTTPEWHVQLSSD